MMKVTNWLLSSSFPTDTLIAVCTFLTLSDISSLDRAATNHVHNGRQYLLQAFSLLMLPLNFDAISSAAEAAVEANKLLFFTSSRFHNVRSVKFPYPIRDFAMRQVSQFLQLEELRLKSPYLKRFDLLHVGQACPRIHTLCIKCPYLGTTLQGGVSEEGQAVMSEVQHFPALTDLTLAYCDALQDSCLEVIARGCRALRVLDVECSGSITGPGICALCGLCVSLTSLDLSGCAGFSLTDAILMAVSDSLPGLRTLRLRDSGAVTWRGVLHLLARKNALQHLALPRCTSVDFADGRPLEQLHLSLSQSRQSGGLSDLLTLDVSRILSVDDGCVQALGALCPVLRVLFVQNCPLLSDACLSVFEGSFSSLVQLHVGNTRSIDASRMTLVALESLNARKGGDFVVVDTCFEWNLQDALEDIFYDHDMDGEEYFEDDVWDGGDY